MKSCRNLALAAVLSLCLPAAIGIAAEADNAKDYVVLKVDDMSVMLSEVKEAW